MRFLRVFLVILSLTVWGCGSDAPLQRPLACLGAASTTGVLKELRDAYTEQSGQEIQLNTAASSVLARQIEQGAPVDLFLSANEEWAEYLVTHKLAEPAYCQPLLRNHLVLIRNPLIPIHDLKTVPVAPLKLTLADPSHVPAGKYAQESLVSIGWWPQLQGRVVPAADVRAALRLVQMGEADLGIVYSSDLVGAEGVELVARLPEQSHRPIVYPLVLPGTPSPEALAFAAYLRGPEAAQIFAKFGFEVLPSEALPSSGEP